MTFPQPECLRLVRVESNGDYAECEDSISYAPTEGSNGLSIDVRLTDLEIIPMGSIYDTEGRPASRRWRLRIRR